MKAMILAAGEGRRMRPLTDASPKALLPIAGKPLIEHVIGALSAGGFRELVINIFHCGEMIKATLGAGERFDVDIVYSREPEPLETGGGIRKALPLLGEKPFLVVNADILTDFDFAGLSGRSLEGILGHLVLTNNPDHHRAGDFAIDARGNLSLEGARLTYAGIAVLSPALFENAPPGPFPLRDLFIPAVKAGCLTGEHFRGLWVDIGTPERYRKARERARERKRDG